MRRILFFLMLSFAAMHSYAQTVAVSGNVTDDKGELLVGVAIKDKSGTTATSTDANGRYSINVKPGASLSFSYIGFATQEIQVRAQNMSLNVTLNSNTNNLNDVVIVGYGQQKRVNVTGSVSQISGQQLKTTKNESVTNMLTGKIPGVRVVQKSAEPGSFSQQFDIRGFGNPLIIVDGVPRNSFEKLDPNDIETISVLKDATAAVYGVQAANGVVLITTKRGKSGTPQLRLEVTSGIQRASGAPNVVNATDWMTLRNELAVHNVDLLNQARPYTAADFEAYSNGTKLSGDWYAPTVRQSAPQTQTSLSASGGNDNTTYYLSLGTLNQQGFWKSGDLKYNKYNIRSTINSRLAKGLNAELQINGIRDVKDMPYGSFGNSSDIYAALWRQAPINTPFQNNDTSLPTFVTDNYHPVALTTSSISGYRNMATSIFQGNFSLTYDIPAIQGLKAKGLYAYDLTIGDNKVYTKNYNLYAPSGTTLQTYPQGRAQVNRSYSKGSGTTMQFSLNYDHVFAAKHNVQVLALYEERTSVADNFGAQRDLVFGGLDQLGAGFASNQIASQNIDGLVNVVTKSFVSTFHYDFKSKYLFDFTSRYDGSSRFSGTKQWGFFPSVSAGWNIAEENFIKGSSTLQFIDNFKLRGSYGTTGDAGGINYQFLTGYNYPVPLGDVSRLSSGSVFDGNFIGGVGFRGLPNVNLTWFTAKTLDLGFTSSFWKGKLGVEFSWFRRNRDGLLANRLLTVPGSVGAPLPQENIESDRSQGVELTLSHVNRIGEVSYNISGNVSFARNSWRYREMAQAGNSYANWRNGQNDRYKNIWFGYGDAGRFTSFQDIANYGVYQDNRSLLPGDYKYEDWNGDGYINALDQHPIGTGYTGTYDGTNLAQPDPPLVNFGFNVGIKYKGFDLDALLQGSAMKSIQFGGPLAMTFTFPNANALDNFLDRWHPVDPNADPYNPNTQYAEGYYPYTGTNVVQGSAAGLQNGSYLRLKTLTLGYTIPQKITKKAGISSARIYANGYNLFTITGVKIVDPEHPSDQYSFAYPLNKTYNLGISVTF